ncbi:MAG TPA: OmpA family protein [Acidiphilium sp.]
MTYTVLSPKVEIPPRRQSRSVTVRSRGVLVLPVVLALAGCASVNPVTLFHRYEGGAIAHNPPPPPGLDDPYPNLASVPPRPALIPQSVQRSVKSALEAENTRQNALPVPGIAIPKPASSPRPARPAETELIRFRPDEAILPRTEQNALRALAARRGAAKIVAIGFAPEKTEADLRLAMLRATAIANQLTLAGVPASAIRIEALAMGRGGAAQLIYDSAP